MRMYCVCEDNNNYGPPEIGTQECGVGRGRSSLDPRSTLAVVVLGFAAV